MNPALFTDSAPADGDCVVWTEEKPVVSWTSFSCEKSTFELDGKMPMLGYYSSPLSAIEEDLPPQYYSRDRRHQPRMLRPLLHISRYIFVDHLLLKVVAVYLFLLYCTGATFLLSPLESSDWSRNEKLTRSHSRDFLTVDVYDFYQDNEAWPTSRLGRVGPDSPLLTYSELTLVGEVEWEVEPETESELDDMPVLDSAEDQTPLPSKVQNHFPLPFRRPSNIFDFSRQLFDQSDQHRPTRPPPTQLVSIHDSK